MDTFEYITALVAVVIGLAIADLATSLHRLLRYRKIVRWDWVAPVAALLMLLELFNLWWRWRGFMGTTTGEVIPYFLALILIYLAASISLPDEMPAEGIDLARYFDENRSYFWLVYATYVALLIALVSIRDLHRGFTVSDLLARYYFDYPWVLAAYAMIFVRKRWISGVVLLASLGWLVIGLDLWDRAPDSPL
ncbi:hypothetical protein LVY65_10025 [Sphingomonas sp. G124]|uniref:Uncharacterized protein n=1 Tax=Sphingomonas cremea TaxID=2904799 RepID=A0A9X1QKI8_9SPHN|nr:hypothetical protein [Sphingomonas cremea]MCF2515398.1 hypothetical protein [Sphingomonas cremea]